MKRQLAFYADAMSRLRVNQQGLSDKNQAAMAQFDDPKVVESFVSLPPRLWDKAATMQKTACSNRITKKARLLVQASVAIEILIFAPMRISNLQGLRLDEHISWQAGRMRINIPRQQVKNDQALDFLLPESVSKRVMQYIDDWRPFLTHQQTPISSLGVMANLKTALRFTIRLKIRFGKRLASGLPHINSGMQPLRFYLMPSQVIMRLCAKC